LIFILFTSVFKTQLGHLAKNYGAEHRVFSQSYIYVRGICIYVVNQQMHTGKMSSKIYY